MTNHHDQTDRSAPLICLLLHENEPGRASATYPLIQQQLPDTRLFIWSRTEPDSELLELLNRSDFTPCLIFPTDRPETQARAISVLPADGRRPLLIIPDGTWKEVRKIVRKSPYLDNLPVFGLTPQQTTRYRLRRNPDAEHICTSEVVAELFRSYDAACSEKLEQALEQFQTDYYSQE